MVYGGIAIFWFVLASWCMGLRLRLMFVLVLWRGLIVRPFGPGELGVSFMVFDLGDVDRP